MNDNIVIAVGGAECGTSPMMPYIGERIEGKEFAMRAKLYLEAALLRCDFDVLDMPEPIADAQDMVMTVNRAGADGAVLFGCGAFGSRKNFNDVRGCVVKYSKRRVGYSQTLAEDVCAHLMNETDCRTDAGDPIWQAAGCPSITVDGGYLTNFDEAKRLLDPDYAVAIAEHVAMGVCEFYGVPYIRRDDILAYPILCSAATGKRGKKIKMLQALLCVNGYPLAVDGVFGKSTDEAVKAFCANTDCADGGVSAAVWRDLLLLGTPRLSFGSRHNAVLYVQRKLRSKLYEAKTDGLLGPDTITAVNEFLSDSGSAIVASERDGVDERAIKLLSERGGGKPRLF